jgi:hypothetical protein
MTCRALLLALLLSTCASQCFGEVIYDISENSSNVVGAYDVNILADDVHFETASIISKIRIRLAIAGVQACKLWIFDATNSPPLHMVPFTNVPADTPFAVSTYDFDMQLQVPKDIYVGFSAQGDGGTNNLSDYWSRGTGVHAGVPGTAGQYYYGPVTGAQLTAVYNSGDSSFGCLQILSEPVRITGMTSATGQVNLAVASLPVFASNAVESSETVGGTNWQERGPLPLGQATATWSESNNALNSTYYRIKSR